MKGKTLINITTGFTLLEVMVVLVLVGIIASFAVIVVRHGGESEQFAIEARRLATLIELSQQEALLQGETRGIYFQEQHYQFMVRTPEGQWQVLARDAFRTRSLPPTMRWNLFIEGQPVRFNTTDDNNEEQKPHVVLTNSGEVTPFELLFYPVKGTVAVYQLRSDWTGQLTLVPVSPDS